MLKLLGSFFNFHLKFEDVISLIFYFHFNSLICNNIFYSEYHLKSFLRNSVSLYFILSNKISITWNYN